LGGAIRRANQPAIVVENRLGGRDHYRNRSCGSRGADGATILNTQTPFIINALLRKMKSDPLTSFGSARRAKSIRYLIECAKV
jgi:hypothetical protein